MNYRIIIIKLLNCYILIITLLNLQNIFIYFLLKFRVNTAITEQCNFVARDNRRLEGASRWAGSANLVGYQVKGGTAAVQYNTLHNAAQVESSRGAADEECKLMTMAEISYIDRIRQIQIENLQQNTPRKYTKHWCLSAM